MRKVETRAATPPGGAYSQAISASGLLFISGQVGRHRVTGELASSLEGQVRLAIRNLEAVAVAGGGSLSSVAKTTCFLADIGQFDVFDQAYRSSFPHPLPARSTVGVSLADGLLFEIEAIVVLNGRAACE